MKVESRAIDRVKPYDKNPRRNDAAVSKVAASIREYGFRQPVVVDEKGVVIVGHTRLKAARSLGLTQVPVHVARGLTPAQVRAYRIADNRTNEEAEWDLGVLAEELTALESDGFDLSLAGFDDAEVADLMDLDALPELDLGPTPKDVQESADALRKIKEQRAVGNDAVEERHDTERYLVVVFPDRRAKEAYLCSVGAQPDERYLPIEEWSLRRRRRVVRRAAPKAADASHTGDAGGFA